MRRWWERKEKVRKRGLRDDEGYRSKGRGRREQNRRSEESGEQIRRWERAGEGDGRGK